MIKIAILTEDRYEDIDTQSSYHGNILIEEQSLISAFEKKGIIAERKSWSNKEVDWASYTGVIFRSTWDYFYRVDSFVAWIENLPKNVIPINSKDLLLWNLNKTYLFDLNRRGVNIPESHLLRSIDLRPLSDYFGILNSNELILKPCISGSAKNTFRISKSNLTNDLVAKLLDLRKLEDYVVQPMLQNIIWKGEISLVFFQGEFSHAVLKRAKQGDFRVQDDFGGTVESYSPSNMELDFAQNALVNCPSLPAYARVDIAYDNNEELCLMEMELIEPELWFRKCSSAISKMIDVCMKQLKLEL